MPHVGAVRLLGEWVDFHYEINGNTYDFSIPGGGFVSLEHVVEVLGIARIDENTADSGDNQANEGEYASENDENTADSDVYNGVEEASVEDNSTNGNAYEESINLNNVEVSEAAKKFVVDVTNVEFSSPELVWVGKASEATTVGGLKEANGLEVQYSAELTEEQIDEINGSTVEAGDWALISVLPFTSEESLTVTMKNGDQWVVKVTDAAEDPLGIDGKALAIVNFRSYVSNGIEQYSGYYAVTNQKSTVKANNNDHRGYYLKADEVNVGYGSSGYFCDETAVAWTFEYAGDDHHYYLKDPNGKYLNINESTKVDNTNAFTFTDNKTNNARLTVTPAAGGQYIIANSSGLGLWNYGEHPSNHEGQFFVDDYSTADDDQKQYGRFYLCEPTGTSQPGGTTGHEGIDISDEEKAELRAWLASLEARKALKNVSKTAQVAADLTGTDAEPYDQRVYEINLTAESAIRDFTHDIDLSFIIDGSNSMKFPSKLVPVKDTSENDVTMYLTQSNLNDLSGNQYYVICQPTTTATVYRLYKNNGTWYYRDASGSGDANRIEDWTELKTDGRIEYTIYQDGDSGRTRLYYLNESMKNAIDGLKSIVSHTGVEGAQSADVNVAYNVFAYYIINHTKFKSVKNDNITISLTNTEGGTRQDLGLQDALRFWGSDLTTQAEQNKHAANPKYAILISDGASVVSSSASDYNNGTGTGGTLSSIQANIDTQAAALKAQGVTLITVGLSTKNVVGGSDKLYSIADSIDGVKQFYEAEAGDDLEYILLKILQTIMSKAVVEGTASDTVDPAFYPVNQDLTPVEAGYYYDSDGDGTPERHDSAPADSGAVYYQWVNNNGTWTINWFNQSFGWADEDAAWNQTFYVKAKENFLGGNTIKTNNEAGITPDGFRFEMQNESGTTFSDKIEIHEGTENIETPIVNVKELSLTGHDAVWTLYLGAPVTDAELKKQASNLFDQIEVNEIVKADGTPVLAETDQPQSFLLKDLIGGSLTEEELNSLIEGASVSRDYTHYGHEIIGTITIALEEGTNENGDTVYTLTASYASKDPVTQDPETGDEISWNNGPNGPGRAMEPITSTNTQTINDYYLPESVEVKKVDPEGNVITTSPALFKLYRKAKGEESGVPLSTYDPALTDLYALLETIHTGPDGIATVGGLLDEQGNQKDESLLMNASDGPYYLIETGAPMGYSRTRTPTVITVTAGPDFYYDLDGNPITVAEGELPGVPYNKKQGVTVTITGEAASTVIMVDADGNQTTLTDGEGDPRTYLLDTDTTTAWQTSITNEKIPDDGGVDQDQMVPHSKKIDYLGDGADNPDTTADTDTPSGSDNANAVNDLYRLYLDATMLKSATNANVILVEDFSSSMNSNKMEGDKTRYEVMRGVLNGDDGFINTVLAPGSGNRMSVIKFSDSRNHDLKNGTSDLGTKVLVNWTDSPQTVLEAVDQPFPNAYTSDDGSPYQYWNSGQKDNSYWTNYELALDYVEMQLNSIPADRQNNPTYVIFLSDGLPTAYMNKENREVGGYESMSNPPSWLQPASVNGKEVIENLNVVLPNTIDAVNTFKRDHTNIQISTIGFAENMNSVITPGKAYDGSNAQFQYAGYHYDFILRNLASIDPLHQGQKLYSQATTSQQLLDALENSLKTRSISKVLISDELSDYVSLYTNQPDLVVSKTSARGVKTNLTVEYDGTENNYKVTEVGTEVGRILIHGKNITLDFADDLNYTHGDTYTLSFNVQATTEAYEEYAQNIRADGNNGYGTETGDPGTDYGINTTSSEKPGFHSNERAYVSYTYKEHEYNPSYDDPVIQVGDTKLEIQKVWADGAPEGIDEVAVNILRDGTHYTSVILKRSEDWKATAEHLVPKKLVTADDDSAVRDTSGNALKKTGYVPYEYTLQEDLSPDNAAAAAILRRYGATYAFTVTESDDPASFTNMTSRYENGKLVYYIPAGTGTQTSAKGEATVTNTIMDVPVVLKKVGIANTDPEGTQTNLGGAVFTIYEAAGENKDQKGSVAAVDVQGTAVRLEDLVSDETTGVIWSGSLPIGDYIMDEVDAPDGYNKIGVLIRMTVDADGVALSYIGTAGSDPYNEPVYDEESGAWIITAIDIAGATLPSTGGPGTNMLYLLGIMLTGLAGSGLVMKRRRRNAA